MSAVAKPWITPQEYLAQERASTVKHEYYHGEVFAMAGAFFPHNRAKENLARALGNRLEGSNCDVLSSDQRVLVESSGLYTYPDIVIYCGTPHFENDSVGDTLINPKVIVEVLSDSTERYDRGMKFTLYQGIKTLAEYVLVSHDRVQVDRYVRQDNGDWTLTMLTDVDQSLTLASLNLTIPLAEIYRDVPLGNERLR